MGLFYASITGTAVLQLKDIPERPAEYDGRVVVFDLCPADADEAAVRNDVGRFGDVVEAAVVAGSPARVRFSSHEEAERCVAALRNESRGASFEYNETSYSREGGTPYSGWCTAEEGAASFVVAHLAKAARAAALPERFARAEARRPKLTDLSGGEARAVVVTVEPVELLEETFEKIEGATFVGKGDREFVQYLLAGFEWTIRSAMLAAEESASLERDEPARGSRRGFARLTVLMQQGVGMVGLGARWAWLAISEWRGGGRRRRSLLHAGALPPEAPGDGESALVRWEGGELMVLKV